MATLKLNDVTAMTESGGTISLDSTVTGGSGLTNGITMVDQWKLTATHTTNDILLLWARPTFSGFGRINGTGMAMASGIFTFPTTGIYAVFVKANFTVSGSDSVALDVYLTVNDTTGSTYTMVDSIVDGQNGSGLRGAGSSGLSIVDVTDEAEVKMKFLASTLGSSSTVNGGTNTYNQTAITFVRLGDT